MTADTNLHKNNHTMASVKCIAVLIITKRIIKRKKLKLQSQLRRTTITNVNFILQPTVVPLLNVVAYCSIELFFLKCQKIVIFNHAQTNERI